MDAAKYAPWVSLLSDDPHHLRSGTAAAYWALAPHYIGQFTDCACSVATATMLVNAARGDAARRLNAKLVSQQALLACVGAETWTKATGRDGGPGVSLSELAEFLHAGLAVHGVAGAIVDRVALSPLPKGGGDRLRQALAAGEAEPGRFVIANFYSAIVLGSGDFGHFSPVGAYDASRDRVLILDVYRFEYEPYWVPVERLLAGMTTISAGDGESRGYLDIRLTAG